MLLFSLPRKMTELIFAIGSTLHTGSMIPKSSCMKPVIPIMSAYRNICAEMDNDSRFGGLVVSDEAFAAITNPVRLERYTGFYVDDFTKTEGIVLIWHAGGAL